MENVTKDEQEKIEKCITPNSFGMDINTLKAPMFIYNNYKPAKDEKGNIVSNIEERTFEWLDSKNRNRKLYMYCKGRLPRQFESDVLFALMGLFIKKNAPFPYNEKDKKYEISVTKVEFSWYELAAFLNVPPTGYYIDRMKEAVRILKQTQYFSYDNGALYDRMNRKYLQSGEEGISLISKYKFKTTKAVAENDEYSTEIDNNFVIFDELILNNLRYEYFKYLSIELYFDKIPSGIERGIYGFLEANRYGDNNQSNKYIKRFYESLRIGIPIDFEYPSELKRRLKKPLQHLKDIGYLKDFAFGDEIKINGQKEECVYFCFDITKEELKKIIERKNNEQLKLNLDNESKDEEENNVSKIEKYLKLPDKNLVDELIAKQVDTNVAYDLVNKNDKWDIIKYLIWLNKQLLIENKIIPNPAGLLRVAIERKLPIESGYKEIIDFINDEKEKEKTKNKKVIEDIDSLYEEYIKTSIKEFREQEPEMYQLFYDGIINDLDKNVDIYMANIKAVSGNISKYEDFKNKRDKSELFNEALERDIKVYKNLKTLEDFKYEYLSNKDLEYNSTK